VFSLAGKKALVVGIANEDSIAFGCAKAFRAQGADLAITFQGMKSEPFVRPIAEKLGLHVRLLPKADVSLSVTYQVRRLASWTLQT